MPAPPKQRKIAIVGSRSVGKSWNPVWPSVGFNRSSLLTALV